MKVWLKRLYVIISIFLASLLCGCLDYDASIQFKGANQGQLVQHVRLDRQLAKLNPGGTAAWLDSIETRTQQLGGKVDRRSEQELVATIPFYGGKDLEARFNQFFQAGATAVHPVVTQQTSVDASRSDSPQAFLSQLKLTQDNYGVVRRNHLVYDLDLTSLSHSPEDLIDGGWGTVLTLNLDTPWGAHWADPVSLSPTSPKFSGWPKAVGQRLTWQFYPGQVNHLDVIFWLPSPLGIGGIVIIGVTLVGFRLKADASAP